MNSNLAGNDPSVRSPRHAVPLQMDPTRAPFQAVSHPPRSIPCQIVNEASDALAGAQDVMPAFKRRKLNNSSESDQRLEREVPKTSSSSANVAVASQTDADGEEPRITQSTLFPLRPRRNLHGVGIQQSSTTPNQRATARQDVPMNASKQEIPSVAPRYQDSSTYGLCLSDGELYLHMRIGPADFHPWTGQHPEDVLNEMTTRSGAYDRVQNPQTELISARQSIWPSLKYKSGLQILSSLYISALNQRQANGVITASSTFKPPPRVTLTDTKREAWLRDLANPSIPLRRLSRTIPHGVRGKILLDHCLSKCIPISRAIWLVKCVGANEMRAFRRKGTGGVFAVGGEARWIKDWTTSIEQFLESTLCACGSAEWKANVNSR